MLVPMRPILEAADKYHYGQGAFNMNSVGQIEAAVRIHELLRSGAILQGAEASNAFMGGELDFMHGSLEAKQKGAKNIGDAVKKYGADSPVPIALHLDHGKSLESVKACIAGGYTSVMIDGSHESFEDNIALTKSVADAGRAMGVPVEAELGKVGGKEDDGPAVEGESPYTDPAEAKEFVERTGCTSLAIGVGTSHGVYTSDPHIEQSVVKAIRDAVDVPLVLHGTSGVPDEQVAEAVKNGICKVNYATELRQAYTKGFMAYMAENPACFDPKKPAKEGMREITELVKIRMTNLNSVGKAE